MTRTTIIAASFASLATLSAPVRADTIAVKPLQAAILEFGSEHAVG